MKTKSPTSRVFRWDDLQMARRVRRTRRPVMRTASMPPAKRLIVGEAVPRKEMLLAPLKWQAAEVVAPQHPGIARGFGFAACACTLAWWLMMLLTSLWRWFSPGTVDLSVAMNASLATAFFGSHLFALLGTVVQGAGEKWGIRALVGFWGGVLIMVPVGTMIHLLTQHFAS